MPPKKDVPKDIAIAPVDSQAPVSAPISGSVFKVQAGVNCSVNGPGGDVSPYTPES
jgi:hypothetical protein